MATGMGPRACIRTSPPAATRRSKLRAAICHFPLGGKTGPGGSIPKLLHQDLQSDFFQLRRDAMPRNEPISRWFLSLITETGSRPSGDNIPWQGRSGIRAAFILSLNPCERIQPHDLNAAFPAVTACTSQAPRTPGSGRRFPASRQSGRSAELGASRLYATGNSWTGLRPSQSPAFPIQSRFSIEPSYPGILRRRS